MLNTLIGKRLSSLRTKTGLRCMPKLKGQIITILQLPIIPKNRLIDDDCTCPVGYNCKHAAALARLFFQEYRQEFQQRYADSQSPQGIAKRQRGMIRHSAG